MSEIVEAAKKRYPEAEIEDIGDDTVSIDGYIWHAYREDELKRRAKALIKEVFETSYDDAGLTTFVKENGGYKDFYKDSYINDIRISDDSGMFDSMSDEQIIDELEAMDWFNDGYTKEMLDFDKMTDYTYDVDGFSILDENGNSFYEDGYNFIQE